MASRTRSGERAAADSSARRRDRLPASGISRVGRALVAHEHRTAAGLFALLVLAYLWPVLIGGDLLSPAAVLYRDVPWQGFAPGDVTHYLNPLLDDVPLSYYPWDVLARQLIHAGTFPAWNPYALGGTPFFANPEVAWLSPFSLPLWILPLNYGLGLAAALKLWMAGFGTYLLVRELRLGFWPGILAGVSFTLCAFNVVWLSHGVHVSVAVMLPWAIWLAERIVRRGRAADGLALAAIAAVVLTGGHPGTQIHVLSAVVLYALVRAAAGEGGLDWGERARRLALLGGALLVGALVAAVALVPAVRAATDTVGAAARLNGGVGLPGATMPASVLRAALLPDWWGRPSELLTFTGPANYNERALYAGTVALLLAAVAAVGAGAWRRKAPFVLLGAIGLAMALGVPGIKDLIVHLPLFDRVQNQRMLLWFAFAVAVLSAFGLQSLLDARERPRRLWAVLAAAFVLLAIAGSATHASVGDLGPALHQAFARSGRTTASILALASVSRAFLLIAAAAAVLLLVRRPDRRHVLAGGLIALLAALDMLQFAHGYQPMGPPSKAIPPRTPAVAFLQRHAADGRIAGIGSALANDWSTVYGIRDVRGYDAPQPSLRFYRLWRTIQPNQVDWLPFGVDGTGPATLQVLGLLGARYIVAPPGTEVSGTALTRAYSGPDATVLVNALAQPRAIVASHVQVARDDDQEIAGVTEASFDPRHDAVIRGADLAPGTGVGATGAGTARVVRESNAEVKLHATLSRGGLVVLDDAWAPGWTVQVDGRPATALHTDVVLRGVAVPAGSHDVVWRYRVPGLRLGAALSGLGLALALGWGGWLLVRRRRASAGR